MDLTMNHEEWNQYVNKSTSIVNEPFKTDVNRDIFDWFAENEPEESKKERAEIMKMCVEV